MFDMKITKEEHLTTIKIDGIHLYVGWDMGFAELSYFPNCGGWGWAALDRIY